MELKKTNTSEKNQPENRSGTLGTFAGVFTPSILTILGIILFLRAGYVVGNAGLAQTLVILLLANGISVLTTISLSAIATNLKVKGGGDYYLISRTLGPAFGGAIGVVLFLAQTISIAFYCLGLGEVVAGILPYSIKILPQIIAAVSLGFLFILAWMGADLATKFQYIVMVILIAALASFFIGGFLRWDNALLIQNWSPAEKSLNFWIIFAIFFPAVTGFTQGVSMSGDLKDAGKSLPLGTFLAVGISIVVYFISALLFAASLPQNVLISDYTAMKQISVVSFLVSAGVISATLSSAMASFLGAPRILQSLSKDRIFPFLLPFAKVSGPMNNPRRGVLLSAGIAFSTICFGNLNLIAPVVSMFFLISYGLLNYATYFEARANSPSFRPRFRYFHKYISLFGSLACLGIIFAIDVTSGIIAISVLFSIYQYVKRTSVHSRWADSRRAYHLQLIRDHLFLTASEPEHPRDWRPHLLVFSNSSDRRQKILQFSTWFQGQSGFTTVVHILEGRGVKMLKPKQEAETKLKDDLKAFGVKAFPLVVTTPTPRFGIHALLQSYGIGPLKANTLLLNWIESSKADNTDMLRYGQHLRTAYRLGCNLLVLDAKEKIWRTLEEIPPQERRIDVWWWEDATSHLMLLLAYLMTRGDAWEGVKIRVFAAGFDIDSGKTVNDLKCTLDDFRIDAEPEIVIKPSADAISAHSSDATLVFIPFRIKNNKMLDPFGGPLEDIIPRLPMVILALASEDINLGAEPEEGVSGEIASVIDNLEDSEKREKNAQKKAIKTAKNADKKEMELKKAVASSTDEKLIAQKRDEAEKAKEDAAATAKRAAKASLKKEDAEKEAEEIGAVVKKDKEE
ncbi:MAG: amino acid permease [Desulfobacterales bacterium]|nr:amino acid permease [Desulfobacterales bacterium]